MNACRLVVCRDSDALAARAADYVIDCSREAVQQRGRFTLVLTGGATPEAMYRLLGKLPRRDAMPWCETDVFVGDERFVPYGDSRSNFGMAERVVLSQVPLPPSQAFPMPTDEPTAEAAAEKYAARLAQFFPQEAREGRPPCFDLVLLGLGEDGHTASLFPGAAALQVEDAWVTWSPPGPLPPPVDRITMTYPVLNAARHVAFLAAGERKAVALQSVLEANPSRNERPAAGVKPIDGTLTWFVDEAAAKLLSRRV
ncbi:MAG: 6-phosphogluconolactonase [Planctomycetaceae bacterium]|nr:6-phosphogluconolactonase [Planctomycetaceae bacterium]